MAGAPSAPLHHVSYEGEYSPAFASLVDQLTADAVATHVFEATLDFDEPVVDGAVHYVETNPPFSPESPPESQMRREE